MRKSMVNAIIFGAVTLILVSKNLQQATFLIWNILEIINHYLLFYKIQIS